MEGSVLYDQFHSFGEITFIFGEPKVDFDPWAYARARAREIASRSSD
jgi:hypothetical protein